MDLQSMAKKIEEMELKIERLQDKHEIEIFMGKVIVHFNQKNMHTCPESYALSMPDVSLEISDRGVLVGAEKIKYLYEHQYQIPDNRGSMLRHFLTNPMIQVAKDGKTAKGLWWAMGIQAVPDKDGNPHALWCFGQWAIDFIRENGEWKIWHHRVYQIAKCSYEKGWVEDYKDWTTQWIDREQFPAADGTIPTKGDVKTTYHNPYTPTSIQESVPACPEPYDTWTDESWIFKNEPQYLKK